MLDGAQDMSGVYLAAFKRLVRVVQYYLRVPDDEKGNAQQAADQHIAPERLESQPQPMHHQIAAEQRAVFVFARQPGIPASKRLERDDARIDGDDGRQPESEEGKEVDVGHCVSDRLSSVPLAAGPPVLARLGQWQQAASGTK